MWCAITQPWSQKSPRGMATPEQGAHIDQVLGDAIKGVGVVLMSMMLSVYVPAVMRRCPKVVGECKKRTAAICFRCYMLYGKLAIRMSRAWGVLLGTGVGDSCVEPAGTVALCDSVVPLVCMPMMVAFSECASDLRPKFGEISDGRLVVLLRSVTRAGEWSGGEHRSDTDAMQMMSVLNEIERARAQKCIFEGCSVTSGEMQFADAELEKKAHTLPLPLEIQNLLQSLVTDRGVHVSTKLGREVVSYVLFSMLPIWVHTVELSLLEIGDEVRERQIKLGRCDVDAESLASRVYGDK